MKVSNWCKKLMASIIAGGALAPAAYAVNIPLADPSFEVYTVPADPGYAYAADPHGAYRVGPSPISPWVDDLDSPPGFTQDNDNSNWIYDSGYAEAVSANNPTNRRAFPRTGNQAMHGLDGNFNAQELGAVFEADKTYSFSVWAQNDVSLDQGDGLGLYLFDGNVAFSAAAALGSANFTSTVAHRTVGMSPEVSKTIWSQHTVKYTTFAGDPQVGHPIGVAFRAFRDTAVDDAALQSDAAASTLLSLEVNTTNGQVRFRNETGAVVNIDYYEIKSAAGALNSSWTGLQQQNLPGFPPGNGSGNGWEKAGGSSSAVVSESYLTGSSAVGTSATVGLGTAYTVGGTHDLTFRYGQLTSSAAAVEGDYNNNGTVDAADYVLWRNGGPLANDPSAGVQASDYDFWRARLGNSAGPSGPSSLFRGPVFYVSAFTGAGSAVPEPATVILVGIGAAGFMFSSRKRSASI